MVPETLVYILKQSRMGRMSNRLIAKILLPDVHSSKNRINRFRGQSVVPAWAFGYCCPDNMASYIWLPFIGCKRGARENIP